MPGKKTSLWISKAVLHAYFCGGEFKVMTVIENGDEFDIHLRSEASVFGLLPSSLVANATLDPDNLEDSVIHNLAISLAAGFVTINGSYNNGIIRGNIEIPLLACSGQVDLRVTNQDASFTASITLYNGELDVNVAAEWDWKLSYFRGSMDNFVTGPFHISSVEFEANSNDDMVISKQKRLFHYWVVLQVLIFSQTPLVLHLILLLVSLGG